MEKLIVDSKDLDKAITDAQPVLDTIKAYQIHSGKPSEKSGLDFVRKTWGAKKNGIRSITIAGFIAAGFCQLTKAGRLEVSAGNCSPAIFAALVGSRPLSHHKSNGLWDDTGLTSDGIVWFNNALNDVGAGGWNSTAQAVRAFRSVFTGKSKEVTVKLDGFKDLKVKRISEVSHTVIG
jgi:hypothetical protein